MVWWHHTAFANGGGSVVSAYSPCPLGAPWPANRLSPPGRQRSWRSPSHAARPARAAVWAMYGWAPRAYCSSAGHALGPPVVLAVQLDQRLSGVGAPWRLHVFSPRIPVEAGNVGLARLKMITWAPSLQALVHGLLSGLVSSAVAAFTW